MDTPIEGEIWNSNCSMLPTKASEALTWVKTLLILWSLAVVILENPKRWRQSQIERILRTRKATRRNRFDSAKRKKHAWTLRADAPCRFRFWYKRPRRVWMEYQSLFSSSTRNKQIKVNNMYRLNTLVISHYFSFCNQFVNDQLTYLSRLSFWCQFMLSVPDRLNRPPQPPPPPPSLSMFVRDGIRASKMWTPIPTVSKSGPVIPTRLTLDLIRPEATAAHHTVTTMPSQIRWTSLLPIHTAVSPQSSTWISHSRADLLEIQFRIKWLDSLLLDIKQLVGSPPRHPLCLFLLNFLQLTMSLPT